MSGIYIILIVVFVVLTILLFIVGMQILLVIFEIKKVIVKVNGMLEGKENLSDIITKERIASVFSYLQQKFPFLQKRK